jgi:phenylacetate-CoA ligase
MMIGGAEEMPAKAVEWIKRVWNGCTVKMCYGTVEQGLSMGFQPCDHHDGYHIDAVDFFPEILEPDADGYGELVFTTLRRTTMPLIRYRSRDVTRIMPPCPCGLRVTKIEKLRGRRDELIVASGGNLYPLMFERILWQVSGLGLDYQVIFKLEEVIEIVEINVETAREDAAAVLDEIKQSASDLYPDLMKNLALGIFQMRVRLRAPGSIRGAGRKLRRLIDNRHFTSSPPDEIDEGVADGQLV